MMKSPFIYGQIADKDAFVNRTDEIRMLKNSIRSGIHQVLISPRRWGKSSLVKKVAGEFRKSPNTRFCFVDMFRVRSEREFVELYTQAILKITSGKMDDVLKLVKKYFTKLVPRISFSPDPVQEFELSVEFPEKPGDIHEVIDFAEKIAKSKKIKLVVCIDEFQNITNFTDSLSFQKMLRSYWQHHKNVVYCLYGSKRHMMTELFENKSMPFYRFGDNTYLQKIEKGILERFVMERFAATGKQISTDFAERLVETMECHPYYVQQLAHLLWNDTATKVFERNWEKAISDLFISNQALYQRDFDLLSNMQVNLLRALIDNETSLMSKDAIRKYKLGTSATVLRSLNGLEKKEIIDRFGSKIDLADPGFKLWLKTKIFI